MMTKINVCYIGEFHEMYLGKDVFLKPYYISKQQGVPLICQYSCSIGDKIPAEYRGCKFVGRDSHHVNMLQQTWDFIKWSIIKARNVNVLYFTPLNNLQRLSLLIYKIINPQGKMVEYGDIEYEQAKYFCEHDYCFSSGIAGWIKNSFNNFYFGNVVNPVVNQKAYDEFKKMYARHGWNKLCFVPPCFDNEMFEQSGLIPIPFEKKEKIMLYVGRLGAHQKNTDMMLDAFKKVDFQDWKVYLIGPVTTSFKTYEHSAYQQKIDTFFEENPNLRDKVILTGPIYDFKKLYEYYIRAKVFVLTSRHEGSANVLSEAGALGCYFVGTDVGIMDTVTNNWQFGTKIEQEDVDGFAEVLNKITHNELEMDLSKQIPMEQFTWDYVVRNQLMPLFED